MAPSLVFGSRNRCDQLLHVSACLHARLPMLVDLDLVPGADKTASCKQQTTTVVHTRERGVSCAVLSLPAREGFVDDTCIRHAPAGFVIACTRGWVVSWCGDEEGLCLCVLVVLSRFVANRAPRAIVAAILHDGARDPRLRSGLYRPRRREGCCHRGVALLGIHCFETPFTYTGAPQSRLGQEGG